MNEETIFHNALAMPAAARAAFLEEVCGSDIDLRRRVESLLHAHDNPDSLMGQAAGDAAATLDEKARKQVGALLARPTETSLPVGQMIGRYKLLQLIGEGGFGTVYMAEQEMPMKRRVALKIIKAGMDTGQVIARFEAERQALAMMDHPNIAKVLDGGSTDDGRPYFVMELVKGIFITEYCDQARLDTEQRLNLFMDVCSAVQHAHQKGVIHRDLKPSNVMITMRDDKPIVKVIDFGIAKATEQKLTEKTLFTAYGQMIGTPAYMSPEQAAMSEFDVDTRSDIYSLGVLLYELLVGSPPFDAQTLRSAGFDEMRRIIREQQPQKPSTKLSALAEESKLSVAGQRHATPAALGSQLHGDLDWIVLKALEKDRARRYESASAFAQDIERHLNAEPVLAAALTAGYMLRKYIRRNKGTMIAAAAIILLLLGGTAVSTWQAVRATRAKAEAITAGIEKGKALDAANRAKTEAIAAVVAERKALDAVTAANERAQKRLTQISKANDILGSVFENLDPKEIAKSERPLQAILVEKLDKAVDQLQGEAIGDPLVVASMQSRFGQSLMDLGAPDKAIVVLKRAFETERAILGADHRNTLASMGNLGGAYEGAGMRDQALPLLAEALRLTQAKLGPEDPRTLVCMNNLAVAYEDAGNLDLALPLLEATLKIRKATLGPDDPTTTVSIENLASAYHAAGMFDRTVPLLEEALKLHQAKYGPNHPDTLLAMNNLATAYETAGKSELAVPLAEETLKLSRAKLGPDHPLTLTFMSGVASKYQAAGRLDLAVPLFEQILKRTKVQLGTDHPDTLVTMNNLASAYEDAGEWDLCLPLFEETLKLNKAKLGPNHPATLNSMNNLAKAYQDAERLDEAISLGEETLKLRKAKLGPDHPDTLNSANGLVASYEAAGRAEMALPLAQETLKLRQAKLGPDHPDTFKSMQNLALAYHMSGRLDMALPLYEQTLKLLRTKLGPDNPNTLTCMENMAAAYQTAGRLDLAVQLAEEAVKLSTAKLGAQHPDTLRSMRTLVMAYWASKKPALALPLLEELVKRANTKLGPDHPLTIDAKIKLAEAYQSAGKFDPAVPLLEQSYQAARKRTGLRWVGTRLLNGYVMAGKVEQAAALAKELLGEARTSLPKDSLPLADTLAPIGRSLLKAKAFADAEPLLRECLAIEQKSRPNDWTTFSTQAMLGGALLGLKKYDEARPLLLQGYDGMQARTWVIPQADRRRLIESLEWLVSLYESDTSALDPDKAADYRRLLATAYLAGGEIERAVTLMEESFRITKARLGPEHADTLAAMDYLAQTYQAAGKLDPAVPLFKQTLELRKAKLGPDHPDTLRSMGYLASAYMVAGKLDEAVPLFEQTLKLCQEKFGPKHLYTLSSMNNLGEAYWRQKQFDKAIPLFEESLKGREAILGRQHPVTQLTVANLGVNYKDAGRLDEALPLLEESYQAAKKFPALRWVDSQLLDGYARTGKTEKAAAIAKELVAETRATSPDESPERARQFALLGLWLLQAKDFDDAEPLLRECLAIRQKNQPDDWSTFNTQSMLGGALFGLKKYDDAEPLLVHGFEGMVQRAAAIPLQADERLTEALERLVGLYESRARDGDAEQAAKYRKLLDQRLDAHKKDAPNAK